MTGLGAVSASALCAAGCAYVVVAPHPRRRLLDRGIGPAPVSYTHLTLPTTPYV